jgi:hypothetical protein
VAKEKKQMEMSPVGQAIWLHMQRHNPPYNRSSLARKLTENGTYPITAASVSNYLGREHPPPEFLNAVVHTLDLGPQQEAELHMLFFRGKPYRRGRKGNKLQQLSRIIRYFEGAIEDARVDPELGEDERARYIRAYEDMLEAAIEERRTQFETSVAARTPTPPPEEDERARLSRSIAYLEGALKDAREAAYAGDEEAVDHVRTFEDMIASLTAQREALGDAAEAKREKVVWRI